MKANSEYWFIHYDRDFADKDFFGMAFKKYETLVTSLPQFKQLSGEYPQSNHVLEQEMQLRVANILDIMMRFFSPDNVAIHSFEKNWINFVQRVQHYINCEKLYALMFWRFTFNNQFVIKRVLGFYIRFSKFLDAFHYSLFKGNDERMKKTRRMVDVQQHLHANFQPLTAFLNEVRNQIEQIHLINKRCNPQSVLEDSLFTKLRVFTSVFLSHSSAEISYELRGFSESRLVVEILHQNDLAIKGLDNYISKYEKEAFAAFEKDKKLFESNNYKEITASYDLQFRPSAETDASEESFWERMEIYRAKHKKKSSQATGLTTNRDYSTQVSSMNTEQTDEGLIPDTFDDYNQNSITKSLRSEKFEEKFDTSSRKSFLDSESFSKSPNNPYNTSNPMMQFLIQEVQEYTKDMQAQSKQQKLLSQGVDSSKMKYGNESMKDIVKALKNNTSLSKKKKLLNSQQESQGAAAQHSYYDQEEDNSEEDENAEEIDEDDEDEEDFQKDSQQVDMLTIKNKEMEQSKIMEFVRNADANLVAITDDDIDFDQNKTTRMGIKRAGDQNMTARTTTASQSTKATGLSQSSFMDANSQSQSKMIANQDENDIEEGDEEIDPMETPQKNHLGEQGLDFKDDDIFDYSYEKDDEDDEDGSDDSDYNGSGDDYDSEEDGQHSMASRMKANQAEKLKLRVPFTQFKSQIENSFIRFLKESLYSQEDADANQQHSMSQQHGQSSQNSTATSMNSNGVKKRTPNVSLKEIFIDNRAVYLNGNSFVHYFRENFWMVLNNFVKKNKVFKVTETILKQPLSAKMPPLPKKRLNACEQMQINN